MNKKFIGIELAENVSVWNIFGCVIIVLLAMFGIMLTITAMQDFLITYCGIEKSNISKNIGFLAACYNIVCFMAAPLWGKLSDKVGRRNIAIGCFLLGAIGFSIEGLTRSAWQIYGVELFLGLSVAVVIPILMAAASDYCQPKERGRIMGVLGTTIGVAALLAIPTGAVLYHKFYYLPYITKSLLYLICAFLCLLFLKKGVPAKQSHGHGHGAVSSDKKENKFGALLRKPRLRLTYIIAFLLGGVMQLDMVIFLPWGKYIANIDSKVLGQYLGIKAGLFTILVLVAGWASKKYSNFNLILFGITGLALCYLTVGLVSSPSVIVFTYISISFFKAFLYPTSLALAVSPNLVSHESRGAALGLYQSFRSVGEISFSALCGYLFTLFSGKIGAGFALSGGVLLPIVVAIIIFIYSVYVFVKEKRELSGQQIIN